METPIFNTVGTVAVPVTDQDTAKDLWERFGLVEAMDVELQPGFRWIEMRLPDGAVTMALVRAGDQLPVGIDTGIRLLTADARAAHVAVRDAGLDAGDLLDWETAPLMFSFCDADGNRFYVSEAG